MNRMIVILSTSLLLMLACNTLLPQSTPTPARIPTTITEPTSSVPVGNLPQAETDVPRVSVDEAFAAIQTGAAVIVDVRSAESFAETHVAGAISIPLTEFENNIGNVGLDKNQWIITYCT